MFRALGAGQTDAALERASRASLDLDRPHAFVQIERAPKAREPVAPWPEVVERVEARLRLHYPAAFFPDGHERLRALLVLPARQPDPAAACAELGRDEGVVIGYTGVHRGADDGARALREAADAARMALVLAPTRRARSATSALGAYKYLVRFAPEDMPRDALYAGIQALAAYDERRQTQLLGTLEQFLGHWRSIGSCAQALHIHPNTLRQRARAHPRGRRDRRRRRRPAVARAGRQARAAHSSSGVSRPRRLGKPGGRQRLKDQRADHGQRDDAGQLVEVRDAEAAEHADERGGHDAGLARPAQERELPARPARAPVGQAQVSTVAGRATRISVASTASAGSRFSPSVSSGRLAPSTTKTNSVDDVRHAGGERAHVALVLGCMSSWSRSMLPTMRPARNAPR